MTTTPPTKKFRRLFRRTRNGFVVTIGAHYMHVTFGLVKIPMPPLNPDPYLSDGK